MFMLVTFIFFGPWRKKLTKIIKLADFFIIVQAITESKIGESSYYIHYAIITWWNYSTKSLKQFGDEIVNITSRKISPIFQKTKRNMNLKYLLSKKTFKNQNYIKFKSHVRLRKKQLHDVSKKQLTVDISWTWLKWVSGHNKNLLHLSPLYGSQYLAICIQICQCSSMKGPIHSTLTANFALIFLQGAYQVTFPKLSLNLVFCKIFKVNDRKNHTVHCFQTLS